MTHLQRETLLLPVCEGIEESFLVPIRDSPFSLLLNDKRSMVSINHMLLLSLELLFLQTPGRPYAIELVRLLSYLVP
jgi:hypothetical protein